MNTTHEALTLSITHEDLAGIVQHDWYLSCYQTNSSINLAGATYAVVCRGDIDSCDITFDKLEKLMAWAGY